MIQKSDYLLGDSNYKELEIRIENEKIGEICLGFLSIDNKTPKSFEDVLNDFDVQAFIKRVKNRAEKYVYILVRTDQKGLKYKYSLDTEEIQEIEEIEPFDPDNAMLKLLIERERKFRAAHRRRMIAIIILVAIIYVMQYYGITSLISFGLLGLTIWITIYKWLHHIVHEKF